MTVRKLKEHLDKFPDNMEVFLAERKSDFQYGLLNSVFQGEINFVEDPNSQVLATDTVVILDEE